MNELLQVFTAFGAMVAGGPASAAPLRCQKQIYHKIDPLLLHDENGHVSEHISIQHREDSPQHYLLTYTIRDNDGAERTHTYHVSTNKSCRNIRVSR